MTGFGPTDLRPEDNTAPGWALSTLFKVTKNSSPWSREFGVKSDPLTPWMKLWLKAEAALLALLNSSH